MAGKVRYLIQRDGRFHARVVVPPRLRSVVGKVELSSPLGPDRREAIRALPKAVARFQERLAAAARQLDQSRPPPTTGPARAGWDGAEAARTHFQDAVAFDSELRDATPLYARHGFIDEKRVADLKRVAAGSADVDEITEILKIILIKFRATDAAAPGWRGMTRLLAQAELAALEVSARRDEGDVDPAIPQFLSPTERPTPPGSVREIFSGYQAELQLIGKGRGADTRWSPIIESLIRFLGHDHASQVARSDIVRWKDDLLKTLAPKTVRDSYLATARAAFGWAVDNLQCRENPFVGVKIRLAKVMRSREKGFLEAEILKASRNYAGSRHEHETMTRAKQWTPLLAAYSGARIGELAQLRAEDVQSAGLIHFIRIAPEAGTVKSGIYRDVPLHPHIIECGFLDYVAATGPGPLFFKNTIRIGKTPPASIVAARMAKWVRASSTTHRAQRKNTVHSILRCFCYCSFHS